MISIIKLVLAEFVLHHKKMFIQLEIKIQDIINTDKYYIESKMYQNVSNLIKRLQLSRIYK